MPSPAPAGTAWRAALWHSSGRGVGGRGAGCGVGRGPAAGSGWSGPTGPSQCQSVLLEEFLCSSPTRQAAAGNALADHPSPSSPLPHGTGTLAAADHPVSPSRSGPTRRVASGCSVALEYFGSQAGGSPLPACARAASPHAAAEPATSAGRGKAHNPRHKSQRLGFFAKLNSLFSCRRADGVQDYADVSR